MQAIEDMPHLQKSIGFSMTGSTELSVLARTVQSTMIKENPVSIPKLKGRAFMNPFLTPADMDEIVLGPGVTAVEMTYIRKSFQFIFCTSGRWLKLSNRLNCSRIHY